MRAAGPAPPCDPPAASVFIEARERDNNMNEQAWNKALVTLGPQLPPLPPSRAHYEAQDYCGLAPKSRPQPHLPAKKRRTDVPQTETMENRA